MKSLITNLVLEEISEYHNTNNIDVELDTFVHSFGDVVAVTETVVFEVQLQLKGLATINTDIDYSKISTIQDLIDICTNVEAVRIRPATPFKSVYIEAMDCKVDFWFEEDWNKELELRAKIEASQQEYIDSIKP